MKTAFKILFLLLTIAVSASAKDIIVSQSGSVKTIKSALELANDGDRIIVKPGTYFECNLEIENRIELIGENLPVIDAQGRSEISQ